MIEVKSNFGSPENTSDAPDAALDGTPANAAASAPTDNLHYFGNQVDQIPVVIHEDRGPDNAFSKDHLPDKDVHPDTSTIISDRAVVSEFEKISQLVLQAPQKATVAGTGVQPLRSGDVMSAADETDPSSETGAGIEKRLEHFLEKYCRTYEKKDLNQFATLFTETAQENGQAFSSLIPIYRRNFSSIDKIKYQIKVLQYSYDFQSGVVDFKGKFALEWLPKGENWELNFGSISMLLIEKNGSLLVERLNYSGYQ
jgi:hypothetical protein